MKQSIQNMVDLMKSTLNTIKAEGADPQFIRRSVLIAFSTYLETLTEEDYVEINNILAAEGYDVNVTYEEVINYRKDELIKSATEVKDQNLPAVEGSLVNTSNAFLIGTVLGAATGMWKNGVGIDTGIGGAVTLGAAYYLKDKVSTLIDDKVESNALRIAASSVFGAAAGFGGTLLGKTVNGLVTKSIGEADVVTEQLVNNGDIEAA